MPGSLIIAVTQQQTGDLFITLLLITAFLFVACLSFRMPVELAVVVMIPVLISAMALDASMYAVGGTAAILAGVIMAKWFFIRA